MKPFELSMSKLADAIFMAKFGIFRAEDYRPQAVRIAGRLRSFLTKGHISLQLLKTGVPATPQEITVFEQIMREMRLHSGVYRTTRRGRFQDLDPFINALLANRFPIASPLEVHDWAASDGLTSAEWAHSLFDLFPKASLHASDLTLHLLEVRLSAGGVFILEFGGGALQYIRRPFVIQLNPPESRSLLINRLLWHRARVKLARLKSELGPHWDALEKRLESTDDMVSWHDLELQKISLLHPEAKALQKRDPRFSIARHSVFEALPHPVDVIRSMNIFNAAYFAPERLVKGARAVWLSLKPGGYWIVGRSSTDDPPRHDVSVLEKAPRGFSLVERYGRGSEIESLALEEQLARTTSRDCALVSQPSYC